MFRFSVTFLSPAWRKLGSLLLVLCLLAGAGQWTEHTTGSFSRDASFSGESYDSPYSLLPYGHMALQNARELSPFRFFHLAGVLPELSPDRSIVDIPAFFRRFELRPLFNDDDFGLLPLPHGPPYFS